MSRGKVAIIGAGGNAREIAEICRGLGYDVAGFLVDGPPGRFDSPSLGDFSWLENNKVDGLVMGVGLPSAKLRLSEEAKKRFPAIPWPVIIDPSAYIGKNVDLEEGAIVGIRAVLTINISIGKFTQINFAASIGHETTIGHCCVINPGANVSGGVVIQDGVMVGSNSTILQYIRIGAGATVGAGAVVTKDVPCRLQMVGVPAKPMLHGGSPKSAKLKSERMLLASSQTDREEWDDLVSNSPAADTYFRPAYALANADENTTATALVLRTSKRRFLLPLLLRKISTFSSTPETQDFDALTPYGYGGVLPLEPGSVSPQDTSELIAGLRQWCLKANVVTCLLRLHPLLQQDAYFDAESGEDTRATLQYHGPTQAIDLAEWNEQLEAPASMKKGRRSDLSYARRNLSVAFASCAAPEAAAMMADFRNIYEETMRRVGATSNYFFPNEYYSILASGLGSEMVVALAKRGEDTVGGSLFFADSRFAHYHLSGATLEGQHFKAQTLLVVAGATWAKQRGCRWLHLGGGRASGDSLYQFKESFGGSTFSYSFVSLIANRPRYEELVELRKADATKGPIRRDYFPAYRA